MNHSQRAHRGPAANLRFLVPALLAALLVVPAAFAQTWTEAGDAGDLVATAQVTAGVGPLVTINGVLSGHGDVDVYCIQLSATPPAGLPLVSINCLAMADPTIYLFSAASLGLNANMTCALGVKQVVAPNVSLAPGMYYVAVAAFDRLPQSIGGDIWQTVLSGPLAPNGPGAGSPLIGWAGPSTFVSPVPYTLNVNPNYFNFCDAVTSSEATSWGSLKARYGS